MAQRELKCLNTTSSLTKGCIYFITKNFFLLQLLIMTHLKSFKSTVKSFVIEPFIFIFFAKFNLRPLLLGLAIKSNKPFCTEELYISACVCVSVV